MNLVPVGVQEPGAKSLPAELKVRNRDGRGFGFRRIQHSIAGVYGIGSLGLTPEEIAADIRAASEATLPLIVATTPGVIYQRDPVTGKVLIYSQPTGSMQNLPVGAGGWPVATLNTPLGSASASGVDFTTLAMLGVVGLVLVMVMGTGGRR